VDLATEQMTMKSSAVTPVKAFVLFHPSSLSTNPSFQLKAQFAKYNKTIRVAEGSEQCLREHKINEHAKSDVGCHLFGHLIVNKVTLVSYHDCSTRI